MFCIITNGVLAEGRMITSLRLETSLFLAWRLKRVHPGVLLCLECIFRSITCSRNIMKGVCRQALRVMQPLGQTSAARAVSLT